MANRSHPNTLVNEIIENHINIFNVLEERETKIEQHKKVVRAIKSLSHMLNEKEAFLERKEGQQIKIDEERDDIKVLKEVMNMKNLERDQRKMEQKALDKAFKAHWRHGCELAERVVEIQKNDEKQSENQESGIPDDEGTIGSRGQKSGASSD
ncbi:hypothetical protein CAEBREN_18769 [Caenorhabditis brenneri]|uniref:Uncharacterized protein n=1 Tax=Caenorhabditis brenneri TaxID=135651 RepID=G0P0K9_CAEBE|nr:hypothetical protein CAEBREN_18769 [Caenorhabditis brenneri]